MDISHSPHLYPSTEPVIHRMPARITPGKKINDYPLHALLVSLDSTLQWFFLSASLGYTTLSENLYNKII